MRTWHAERKANVVRLNLKCLAAPRGAPHKGVLAVSAALGPIALRLFEFLQRLLNFSQGAVFAVGGLGRLAHRPLGVRVAPAVIRPPSRRRFLPGASGKA